MNTLNPEPLNPHNTWDSHALVPTVLGMLAMIIGVEVMGASNHAP